MNACQQWIVDKGKLIGIVTKDNLLKASPSQATALSRGEPHYLMSRLTVKEIMKKDVITVTPDTTIERAAAIAQENRVGCLPVVEGERVVGIVTTNSVGSAYFCYLLVGNESSLNVEIDLNILTHYKTNTLYPFIPHHTIIFTVDSGLSIESNAGFATQLVLNWTKNF